MNNTDNEEASIKSSKVDKTNSNPTNYSSQQVNNCEVKESTVGVNTPSAQESFILIERPPKGPPPQSSTLFGVPTIEITAAGSILTAVVSLAVAISTIIKYSKDYNLQLKQRIDQKEELAIEKAKSKIEKFYGPLNAHLEESRIIYEHFATEEKDKLKKQGDYFRTLRYLTNDTANPVKGITRFKPHDQELLKHILKISDQIIHIIEEHSGHVDNASLHTLLGKLAAHYRIIKSASNGLLTDQADYLENIVFPLEINGAINSEICKLTRVIENEKPLPVTSSKTVDFYDKNHLDYYRQTSHSSEMGFTYDLVREFVRNGSNILDAGCGVGRDTKYFIQHGFKVVSFDASKKMVDLCNEYPFAFCEHKCFETIKYPPVFDLVWSCASLLHLNKPKFEDALIKLHRAMKPSGILYFSLKSKVDHSKTKGRDFYTYPFEEVKQFLESELNMTHLKSWSSVSAISSAEHFENYIFRK